MKKFLTKFLLPFAAFVGLVSMIATPAAHDFNLNPFAVTGALVVGAFAYAVISPSQNHGFQLNGLEIEVWANYIIERFWKDNQFLAHAFNDDDKVLAGKIVHIPNPGAVPKVTKNRTQYPMAIVKRADTDVVYLLDEYSTDPTAIHEAEKIELSYDKINSVYGDHAGVISQSVAEDLIIKWLTGIPQASITKTTGANTGELAEGLTGNRKVFTHLDLKKWQRKFNAGNVPLTDRKALLTANMMDELTTSLNDQQFNAFNQFFNAETGVLGKLYGFDVMMRSSVAYATNVDAAASVIPFGGAAAGADSEAALIWQKDAVARALGEVKFFENLERAEYQADIYSSYLRAGGRRRRSDDLGVGMIIQATGV